MEEKTSHIYKNWGGKNPIQMQQNRKKKSLNIHFSAQFYSNYFLNINFELKNKQPLPQKN